MPDSDRKRHGRSVLLFANDRISRVEGTPMTKLRGFLANRQVVVSLVVITAALMGHFVVLFTKEIREGAWTSGIGNAAIIFFCVAFIGFLSSPTRR